MCTSQILMPRKVNDSNSKDLDLVGVRDLARQKRRYCRNRFEYLMMQVLEARSLIPRLILFLDQVNMTCRRFGMAKRLK